MKKKIVEEQNQKLGEYPRQVGVGHRHLVTRREFVGHGVLAGSAFAVVPSLLSLISEKAYGAVPDAAACKAMQGAGSGKARIPFLIIDQVSGATHAGREILAGGGAGGQSELLSDFRYLGLNRTGVIPAGEINSTYGLRFHSTSNVLQGMESVFNSPAMTAARNNDIAQQGGLGFTAAQVANIKANIDGMLFANVSGDDTSNNPHNPAYFIVNSGTRGRATQIVGSGNTADSRGRSRAALNSFDASLQAVRVSSKADAAGLVNAGGLVAQLGEANAQEVLKATRSMSSTQIQNFSEKALPEQSKILSECGYIGAASLVEDSKADNPDPNADPLIKATNNIAGVNNANVAGGFAERIQTMAKLVVDGFAGAGTVELGNCDFHATGLAGSEARSRELGIGIAMSIAIAASKGKSLMIYVITDGSASSRPGNAVSGDHVQYTAEDGDVSSAVMIVYRHPANAEVNRDTNPILNSYMLEGAQGRRQVGFYRVANGTTSVNTTAGVVTTNSVSNLAIAAVANYMALHGEDASKVAAVVKADVPFSSEYDKYVGFKKIV